MRAIRGKDTRPELKVRRYLHAAGLRFRLHRGDLPGRPDIVLPASRTAVFVHGCFWHQHSGCDRTGVPATNREYWLAKFSKTRQRDERAVVALSAAGWHVEIMWECQIDLKHLRFLVERIRRRVRKYSR